MTAALASGSGLAADEQRENLPRFPSVTSLPPIRTTLLALLLGAGTAAAQNYPNTEFAAFYRGKLAKITKVVKTEASSRSKQRVRSTPSKQDNP